MLTRLGIQQIASRFIPANLKPLAKRLYYRDRNPFHPAMKRFGTVQDLYYWVADGNLDTFLVLQNYFSPIFPGQDTATSGTVSLFDNNGGPLGTRTFSLEHCGSARFRVSELIADFQSTLNDTFGSLEVNIAIPEGILNRIQEQNALYFWDRFYIGYSNKQGQPCFVHGIDKTHIYHQGASNPVDWYETPQNRQWAPETPVDIEDYQKFSVIMLNRTSHPTNVTLTLLDKNDEYLDWSAAIPSKGVRRFELSKEDTHALVPSELRMRIEGMATQYGRPMVFKEFQNGAISAMHC